MSERSILLIDHGDLPSLAALSLQGESASLVLWHPAGTISEDGSNERRNVVEQHRRLFNVTESLTAQTGEHALAAGGGTAAVALATSRLLLDAMLAAMEHGCSRVIWPVHVGWDPDRIAAAADRADALMTLGVTSAESPEAKPANSAESAERTSQATDNVPVIELPVVDFSDAQLVDVIEDTGTPRDAFHPGKPGSREFARWRRAFEQAGSPWPWSSAASEPTAAAASRA